MNFLLESNGSRFGQSAALIDNGHVISWTMFARRVKRLAHDLARQGIGAGDRVALLLLDGAASIELVLAAGRIGAIAVPLNWRLAPPELAWIIGDAGPRAIYASRSLRHLLPEGLAIPCHEISDSYDCASAYHAIVETGPELGSGHRIPAQLPLYMLYTSGTTGRPKGCLHSHAGVLSAAIGFAMRRGFRPGDCLLSTNPLFHVSGMGHALAVLAAGGAVCFTRREADGEELLRLAVAHRCSVGSLIDGRIAGLRRAHQRLGGDLCFRSMTTSGGVVAPEKFGWLEREWNCLAVGGWGQTEAGGFALQIDYPDMLTAPTSIGWPMANYGAAVLDEAGEPIATFEAEGELGLCGAAVTLGYWQNPEASAAALGTGWLRSGDTVRRDAEGRFHMLGRAKELIKTGGENVYPAEVEKVLLAHPAIADAAISGAPHAKWTEAVRAHIVVRPGHSISHDEITQWCRQQIAGYKRPRYIDFIDAIPRDGLGKVRRLLLTERPLTKDQAAD